ncbi:hypothetical protein MASR1M107_09160 [Ignavibacteriales bacterium]
MKNIAEITNDSIKDQLNEYHLMVAEILSGFDAELVSLKNGNADTESKVSGLTADSEKNAEEITGLKQSMQIIRNEVILLMAKFDELKEFTEQGFNHILRRIDG